MATTEELEADLAALEQAKRDLLRGTRAVSVSYSNGASATFQQTELSTLTGAISEIKHQLGQGASRARRFGFGGPR